MLTKFETATAEEAHPLVGQAIAELGLAARIVRCDPTVADTAQFCRTYGVLPEDSANTIVVIGKGADPTPVAACLVLATTRLDVNDAVRRRFGTRKASFASQELACELTAMEYGGITVLGLRSDLPLWVDAAVLARGEIIIGGGNRSTKVQLAASEVLRVPGVEVVEGLARPVAVTDAS